MSEILREQSQWRRGKTPLVGKYVADHSKLFAEIAGRGFLALPGYAYNLENNLELMAKTDLSELNFKILSETIDRELKQLGIDYGLAYKNALITWESEKQDLMSAWDSEFAGIKQGMASEEETLNLLAIEVGRRSIILIEGKTAIELDMEAYRKTLAELDGTMAPYEVQLANAKLLTAQRKLTIIPILQEIIAKEQELLTIEQTKATAYTTYMAAEQEVAKKKQQLTPFVNTLATKVETYATKIITEQIPIEKQIADEKVTQAGIAVEKAGLQVEELTAEIATEEKSLDLMDAKRTLEETRFENEQSLVTTEKDLTDTYHDAEVIQFNTLLAEEKAANTNIIADKTTVHTKQKDMRLTSATTITTKEISTSNSITSNTAHEEKEVAKIKAAAKISAKLEHLIG